jgi:hypothetical protein
MKWVARRMGEVLYRVLRRARVRDDDSQEGLATARATKAMKSLGSKLLAAGSEEHYERHAKVERRSQVLERAEHV